MNQYDCNEEPVLVSPVGRKRIITKENHKREKIKKMRHSGGGKMPAISCFHTKNTSKFCHADQLTTEDLLKNFEFFYSRKNKIEQDNTLLDRINVMQVRRRRLKVPNEDAQKNRHVTNEYTLLTNNHPTTIKVCKATFCSVLGVGKDRVSRVASYYATNAATRPERRGGVRNAESKEANTQAIINHIQSFTCRASHYGRREAPGRKYLPNDLSIRKMYELFKGNSSVSYSLYYSVFTHKFNLGFGHPATDTCAICTKFRSQIRDSDLTDQQKRMKWDSFSLHRRRARKFYDLLGNVEEGAVTVCFDMMQNLVLPKTSIGKAFYSRQLYMYVFGVVVHHGKGSTQEKTDIHLYTWMEHENRKGSNMISSALDDCFRSHLYSPIRSLGKLNLFSDSCFGQNKNMTVISMLFALREQISHLKIQYIFPIRGHSFLPADRVFGRIQQHIKKRDTILMPDEYYDILKEHGNVHIYGKHWKAYDIKNAAHSLVKSQRQFKLTDVRMLEISSNKLAIKQYYNGEYEYHPILKRGKRWAHLKPKELPNASTVKEEKKKDIRVLLDEIGVNDSTHAFYTDALSRNNDINIDSDEE